MVSGSKCTFSSTSRAEVGSQCHRHKALNAPSRALLVQKLDHSSTAASIAGTLGTPVISSSVLAAPPVPFLGAPAGVSSLVAPLMQSPVSTLGGLRVAGLSVPPPINISSVHTTEPDFDLDIKEDVQGECAKFGPLKHIFVDKNSAGFVYLRFNDTQSAINEQRALHGRWFAGKMITATFMDVVFIFEASPELRGRVLGQQIGYLTGRAAVHEEEKHRDILLCPLTGGLASKWLVLLNQFVYCTSKVNCET
ncbi:hypothetical protein Nepgr_028428 [Nepenthes gracilis]|uniref:RRM domain-containing protein n=1 Tax=Nepenthes gracilis TaxID=150966 RepID=A0AAD3TAB4_NEPGR|nr:hypothetical protein Nepgr_028428 [Nepenthes gracilis]